VTTTVVMVATRRGYNNCRLLLPGVKLSTVRLSVLVGIHPVSIPVGWSSHVLWVVMLDWGWIVIVGVSPVVAIT
jgi:hypothetical protein